MVIARPFLQWQQNCSCVSLLIDYRIVWLFLRWQQNRSFVSPLIDYIFFFFFTVPPVTTELFVCFSTGWLQNFFTVPPVTTELFVCFSTGWLQNVLTVPPVTTEMFVRFSINWPQNCSFASPLTDYRIVRLFLHWLTTELFDSSPGDNRIVWLFLQWQQTRSQVPSLLVFRVCLTQAARLKRNEDLVRCDQRHRSWNYRHWPSVIWLPKTKTLASLWYLSFLILLKEAPRWYLPFGKG